MKPVLINGKLWTVSLVPPHDARLIDRTGSLRLATTDPASGAICISSDVGLDMIDSIMLHEVAHAITISYGLLAFLRDFIPSDLWLFVEEWSVNLVERFSIEALEISSQALGRPLCIRGLCSSVF